LLTGSHIKEQKFLL